MSRAGIESKATKNVRKILVVKHHEYFEAANASRNLGVAMEHVRKEFHLDESRMSFDLTKYPVALKPGEANTTDYVLSASFDDEGAAKQFAKMNPNEVIGTYNNVQIGTFRGVCPSAAVGTHNDVSNKLNMSTTHSVGGKGTGVKVIIVDSGIDGTRINVSGGFSPRPGDSPGSYAPDHGTMVAFDALIGAPNAMIFDYALLRSQAAEGWVGFLSDGIAVFSEIMREHLKNPGPKVVVNSWGIFDLQEDAPSGNPQSYADNPQHPFNQITSALVGSGVDVVFAAGNCGSQCPDSRCGTANTGPGNSIHGANSHPMVTSVAACTIEDEWLGYSSEGPGNLDQEKPDITGFSHFKGSGVYPQDGGTSAACPVVAGVIAALRSTPQGRDISPEEMRKAIIKGARKVHASGSWDSQFGHGIIDADAALAAI